MTDKIDDGGPAYPNTIGNRPGEHGREGMSLRDAMAIGVAGHIWADFQGDVTLAREYNDWREGVAQESYRLADAMLRARSQGGSE